MLTVIRIFAQLGPLILYHPVLHCVASSSILQEGEQLTIQNPLPEFEEILLSCARRLRHGDGQTAATSQVYHCFSQAISSRLLEASKLGEALIGEDDEGTSYVLDTVQDSDSGPPSRTCR